MRVEATLALFGVQQQVCHTVPAELNTGPDKEITSLHASAGNKEKPVVTSELSMRLDSMNMETCMMQHGTVWSLTRGGV